MKKAPKVTPAFSDASSQPTAQTLAPLEYTISESKRAKALNPPVDNSVVEDLHGYKVADPFRPLENLDAPETTAWVDAQNAQFAGYVADQQATIDRSAAFMEDAMNYTRRSLPSRYGNNYFSSVQEGLAPQPIYQVQEGENGTPRTLFDVNTLSADGTASLSGTFPSPDGTLVAYLVSQAGSDMQTMKIRNVATGEDLPDVIEGCRFASVLWDKDSENTKEGGGFQYTYPVTPGAWGRKAMHHKLGEPVEKDQQVFEKKGDAPWASPFRVPTKKFDWIQTGLGFDQNNGLHYRPVGSNEPFKTLNESGLYEISPVAELDNGDILAVTTKDASLGRLVRINLADPAPEKWQDVIPQHPQDDLTSAFYHQGKIYAFYNHDTADQISVFDVKGRHLHDVPLPVQSVVGFGKVNPEDASFMLRISGFTTAGDTYKYDLEKNTLELVKKSDCKVNLDGAIVERITATSKDGTQVPMTVIRMPETKLDGTAALKLYGYGASANALGPGFSFGVADWVKNGGIYVQTNIRGGGEYGARWYDEGRQLNKKNVFDDFIACAEEVIKRGYTKPERLVIEGGSAGGLLTATVMTKRPELFGAVVSAVPVTDVVRLHKTRGGQAIPEYGDPDNKRDFEAIVEYSPYHNVAPGVKLPPHVYKTGDHDNRVPPLHAYKMAALSQAQSAPGTVSLLRVEKDAGHGAGKPTKKIIREHAETMAFVEKSIGPINQLAYKAWLAAKKAVKRPPAPGQ